MRWKHRSWVGGVVCVAISALLAGCGESSGDGSVTGGTGTSGGEAGAETGGADSSGPEAGGAETGGAETGGAETDGTAAGAGGSGDIVETLCKPHERFCQHDDVFACVESGTKAVLFADCGADEVCDPALAACRPRPCEP